MKFVPELQKIMVNDNYLIAIRDNFENLLIKSVLKITDQKLQSEVADLNVKNRIFSVVVECVQNICKKDGEKTDDNKKDSILLINKINEGFRIVAGTKIDQIRKERLSGLLDDLSCSSNETIKNKWRGVLTDDSGLNTGNKEQLALIELYLRSEGNVNYVFEKEEDDLYYFMIQIEILNK